MVAMDFPDEASSQAGRCRGGGETGAVERQIGGPSVIGYGSFPDIAGRPHENDKLIF